MDVVSGQQWLDQLGQAWRNGDAEAAAGLFTAEAKYHSHPFHTPLQGRSAIVGYWSAATENQTGIEVTFGEPLVAGERMAVEWWSVTNENGRPATDAGGLFLTFEDGLCSDLREYWNLTDGSLDIPEGWGR